MTFIIPFLSLLLGGFISIIITNKNTLSTLFAVISTFAFLFLCFFIFSQNLDSSYIFGNFAREIGIEYRSNNINFFIAFGVSFFFFVFSIFLFGFIKNYTKEFDFNILFAIIQIMGGAILATSFTFDLFNFYVFFELTAICIYILLTLGGKGASFASLNYLILGVIASSFIVLGIGFLYFSTGYLNIGKISELIIERNINLTIPFIFICTGLLVKLAIFPFSFWPGLIYKNFPSAIIPIYASVISFITLYAFYLFYWNIFYLMDRHFLEFFKSIMGILIFIGVTLFSGFAIFELDIRKIFAYSTISQVSYAFFVILFEGGEGISSGLLHIFNNSLCKLALFIILFEVTKEYKNYALSSFNMLVTKSKLLCIVILFLLASVLGIPLTLGFFTKVSMILVAFKNIDYLFIFIILLGAALNFIYFWKIVNIMFFCKKDETVEDFTLDLSIFTKISLGLILLVLVLSTIFFTQISTFLNAGVQDLFIL